MDDHTSLTALCFGAAILLSLLFAFGWSRDDKPIQSVRLEDRHTWRREKGFFEENWAHIAFPLAIGAGLCIFFVSI